MIDSSLPYASVAEERDGGDSLTARYDYGDDLVRLDRSGGVYYYLYDGLGSTRQLTDSTGAVTDAYSYDAFGNLTSSPQPTPNPFLFNGQQMDGSTGLYYLRARYMNPGDGRFLSQDPFGGSDEDPASLHRYLYADSDPVNMIDPSGNSSASFVGGEVELVVAADFISESPRFRGSDLSIGRLLGFGKESTRPDLIDTLERFALEIKPASPQGFALGPGQLLSYILLLNTLSPPANWREGETEDYFFHTAAGPIVPVFDDNGRPAVAVVYPPVGGVIYYTVFDLSLPGIRSVVKVESAAAEEAVALGLAGTRLTRGLVFPTLAVAGLAAGTAAVYSAEIAAAGSAIGSALSQAFARISFGVTASALSEKLEDGATYAGAAFGL